MYEFRETGEGELALIRGIQCSVRVQGSGSPDIDEIYQPFISAARYIFVVGVAVRACCGAQCSLVHHTLLQRSFRVFLRRENASIHVHLNSVCDALKLGK